MKKSTYHKKRKYKVKQRKKSQNTLTTVSPLRTPVKSAGEEKVAKVLDKYTIKYIREKKFPWLLGVRFGEMRLDFYLPDYQAAIEFDGIYHDNKRQKANDEKKNILLFSHGIRLLRINYKSFNRIEKILKLSLNIEG